LPAVEAIQRTPVPVNGIVTLSPAVLENDSVWWYSPLVYPASGPTCDHEPVYCSATSASS